jgi:hypothetical protein
MVGQVVVQVKVLLVLLEQEILLQLVLPKVILEAFHQ